MLEAQTTPALPPVFDLDAIVAHFEDDANSDMTHAKWVEWAVLCAERVLPAFETAYPDDARPRQALDAARAWLANPRSEETRAMAYATRAAYAAVNATRAAARAAYAAADAAYAAANAAARAAERQWQAIQLLRIANRPGGD